MIQTFHRNERFPVHRAGRNSGHREYAPGGILGIVYGDDVLVTKGTDAESEKTIIICIFVGITNVYENPTLAMGNLRPSRAFLRPYA